MRRLGTTATHRLVVALPVVLLLAAAACGDGPTAARTPDASLRQQALDAGLAPLPAEPVRPLENPYVPERVELGHMLFFDPLLSGPKDVACSTCHLPRFAFGDGRQFPVGAGGSGLGPERTDPEPAPLRPMPRNSPTILNVGLFGRMGPEPTVNGTIFWGGTAFGIEDQALAPLAFDKEMRGLTYGKDVALDSVLGRLRRNGEYVDRFAAGFPQIAEVHDRAPERLVTSTTLRRALAAYIRELVTPSATFDAYLNGDDDALNEPQKEGLALFIGKADCVACHTGPMLSDFSMHVLGAPQAGVGRDTTPEDDLGWGEVGGEPYAFRTPPLRQVAETAPYLHAGTEETLTDVLEFKNRGRSEYTDKVADADLDPLVEPLGLNDEEIASLAAFLRALTDTITTQQPLFRAPDRVPSGLTIPK